MNEVPRGDHYAPSAYAVVIPVDRLEAVRVIDWPGRDSMDTFCREIDCEAVDLRVVGELGFWVDDEGVLGEGWEVNGRAAWLAVVMDRRALLVAGSVVITLAEPDGDGTRVVWRESRRVGSPRLRGPFRSTTRTT